MSPIGKLLKSGRDQVVLAQRQAYDLWFVLCCNQYLSGSSSLRVFGFWFDFVTKIRWHTNCMSYIVMRIDS